MTGTINNKNRIISGICAFTMSICFTADFCTESSTVEAASVYSTEYNISEAVNYAEEWYNKLNPEYDSINSWVKQFCTTLTSEALEAGGINLPHGFMIKSGLFGMEHEYYNTMWTVAADQYTYLTETLGYRWEEANASNIHMGDIIYYSKNGDKITHAAICIGNNSEGKPVRAQRNDNKIAVWNQAKAEKIYVVHMTDTTDLTDVTSEYVGKTVALKSAKNGKYVSLSSGNVTAESSSQAKINVVANKSIRTSAASSNSVPTSDTSIGLSFGSGKYASATMDEALHPVKTTASLDDWESFRIFRNKNNKYFIQSMRDGKFLEVRNDNKIYASADSPSTWEEFIIEKPAAVSSSQAPSSSTPASPFNGIYFRACDSKYNSIVDALKSIGASTTMDYRRKIASVNNIPNYSGTAVENITMLNLLKSGKLLAPEKNESVSTITNVLDKINDVISEVITSAVPVPVPSESVPVCDIVPTATPSAATESATASEPAAVTVKTGDINSDGNIDVSDLTVLSTYLVGDTELSGNEMLAADIDKDGTVTLLDLATFKQFLTKQIEEI